MPNLRENDQASEVGGDSIMKWVSATVNEEYSSMDSEGLEGVTEGTLVQLSEDGTWCKL